MRRVAICLAASLSPFLLQAQAPPRPDGAVVIIRPARVFDGAALQEGWAVRIRGERIEAAGPAAKIAAVAATPIDLPGTTLSRDTRTSCCTRTTRRPGTIKY